MFLLGTSMLSNEKGSQHPRYQSYEICIYVSKSMHGCCLQYIFAYGYLTDERRSQVWSTPIKNGELNREFISILFILYRKLNVGWRSLHVTDVKHVDGYTQVASSKYRHSGLPSLANKSFAFY